MLKQSTPVIAAVSLVFFTVEAWSQQIPPAFPDGPGKDIVVATCGGCHDINRIRAGYTPAGWNTLQHMMQNFGTPIAPEDWPAVTAYLTKNFPERPRPPAVIIAGPVQASIKLWDVPTLGSRPHDPARHQRRRDMVDRTTVQQARPSRSEDRHDPGIHPQDAAHRTAWPSARTRSGNIWFTGNHAALIGKLDPKTGVVTEYKMPDPKVKDPHSLLVRTRRHPVVHRAAIQRGRSPRSQDRRDQARHYADAALAALWHHRQRQGRSDAVRFGTNKLATVDPTTMEVKEYALPNAASRPRRIAIVGDEVYYADFSRGFLGRLNLATGEHKEWPSPSGPKSQPYGIVFAKDAIWYNESFAKPNTIVRFDPKTEKFQSWAIPGGGDIVRKMDVTPDGNPVTANSLTNQVGLVEVK